MRTTSLTPLRRAALVAAAASVAATLAACGQKADVATAGGVVSVDPNGNTVVTDPNTGQVLDSSGAPLDGGGGLDSSGVPLAGGGGGAVGGSGATGGGGGGEAGGGGTDGGGGGGEGDNPAPAAPAGGGDRTGVSDDTIKIGVHAPVTGAAAVPQQSFENAIGVYFDAINKKGGINGRKVEIKPYFEDDQFRPDVARTKCKSLAEQDGVFMIIGGAGADQIDACARYAAEAGVPYVSAGVHESRPGQASLASLSTYFALSLTYDEQVPLLARAYKTLHSGKKVVVITADNDSLNGYHAKAEAALRSAAGGNLAYAKRIPKNTQAEALSIGTEICNSGASAVIWNASPSTLINVTKSMTCTPQFIGPGLTNGLNIVATATCPNLNGALFYSPFPGMDVMRRNSQFVSDYQAANGSAPDDIGAAIYGVEKVVGAMLQAAGKDLTREGFIAAALKQKSFQTGVYPTANFNDRLGGTAMHLLKADCGRREWVTARTNEKP